MDWHGARLGRCSLIWVLSSTTRTASLIMRSRSVSNWAVRQDERRGMSVRRLHISQWAAPCRNRRNWLAVAFVHEVRSAAR